MAGTRQQGELGRSVGLHHLSGVGGGHTLIVLAVHPARTDALPVFNPGPETALAAGDTLIVLGEETQVDRLRHRGRSMVL